MYEKILSFFEKYRLEYKVSQIEALVFSFFSTLEYSKETILSSKDPYKTFLETLYVSSSLALKPFDIPIDSFREYNLSSKVEDSLKDVVKYYYEEICNVTNVEEIKFYTQKYFEKLKRTAKNRLSIELISKLDGIIQKSPPLSFEEGLKFKASILEKMEKQKMQELSQKSNEITGNQSIDTYSTFEEIEQLWKDIIGNDDVKQGLRRIIRCLFAYDFNVKKNPWLEFNYLPKSILLEGPPGTGKTSLINATIREMKYLSRETKKPFSYYSIDNTIKSSLYGESVHNLAKIIREGNKLDSINLIIIEDIDSIFYQRTDNIHHADSDLLNYLMNALEGVGTVYRGNTLYISTTNAPERIDNALRSRLSQKRYFVLGPTSPEQYALLIKSKLRSLYEKNLVRMTDEEVLTLGKYFHERSISAREVSNFITHVINESISFDKIFSIEEVKNKTYQEYLATIVQNFKPLTYPLIISSLYRYFSQKSYLK
ncbi:MAG: ATP-binding protein [Candidatus Woesearchaeota archaeon]